MAQNSEEKLQISHRVRELNIIYFVDSSRTRSFKTTVPRFMACCGALIILVLWSLLSIYLVIGQHKEGLKTQYYLRTALATIFDYQTRHDNVYETAYPSNQLHDVTREKQNLAALSQAAMKPPLEMNKKFESLYESLNQRELEVSLAVPENFDEWPIKIEDAVLYKDEGSSTYELNFAIRNIKSPLKHEGYIWAVATFATTSGKKYFTASPIGAVADDHGRPTLASAKHFEYYGIRYYKAEGLRFAPNSDQKAFIVHITVGITDRTRKTRARFELIVQPEIDPSILPMISNQKISKDKKREKNVKPKKGKKKPNVHR